MQQGTALVYVEYNSLYVQDMDMDMDKGVIPENLGNGLVHASPGCAIVLTGRRVGHVPVTVQIGSTPISPDTGGAWEDVVEICQTTLTGRVAVFDWAAEARTGLPVLTVAPGSRFQLRVHARRRSDGAERIPGPSPEEHLIQPWPLP